MEETSERVIQVTGKPIEGFFLKTPVKLAAASFPHLELHLPISFVDQQGIENLFRCAGVRP